MCEVVGQEPKSSLGTLAARTGRHSRSSLTCEGAGAGAMEGVTAGAMEGTTAGAMEGPSAVSGTTAVAPWKLWSRTSSLSEPMSSMGATVGDATVWGPLSVLSVGAVGSAISTCSKSPVRVLAT